MDWGKTLNRLARKHNLTKLALVKKAGYVSSFYHFVLYVKNSKVKNAANALGIKEEVLILEALRDSKNIPDYLRIRILRLIKDLSNVKNNNNSDSISDMLDTLGTERDSKVSYSGEGGGYMRKREKWMKRKARVTACGEVGTLTSFVGFNKINGIDYVYNIRVRLDGESNTRVYHPGDVHELK